MKTSSTRTATAAIGTIFTIGLLAGSAPALAGDHRGAVQFDWKKNGVQVTTFGNAYERVRIAPSTKTLCTEVMSTRDARGEWKSSSANLNVAYPGYRETILNGTVKVSYEDCQVTPVPARTVLRLRPRDNIKDGALSCLAKQVDAFFAVSNEPENMNVISATVTKTRLEVSVIDNSEGLVSDTKLKPSANLKDSAIARIQVAYTSRGECRFASADTLNQALKSGKVSHFMIKPPRLAGESTEAATAAVNAGMSSDQAAGSAVSLTLAGAQAAGGAE